MAKKSSASSRPARLVRKTEADIRAYAKTAAFRKEVERLRAMPDSAIDYSDIPPLTEEQWARAMRFRDRPRKVVVSARLDPRVVDWLKAKGEGHLTRMNDILVNLMEHEWEVAEKRNSAVAEDQSAKRIDREVEPHGALAPMQAPKTDAVLQALVQKRERLGRASQALAAGAGRRGRPPAPMATWTTAKRRSKIAQSERGKKRERERSKKDTRSRSR